MEPKIRLRSNIEKPRGCAGFGFSALGTEKLVAIFQPECQVLQHLEHDKLASGLTLRAEAYREWGWGELDGGSAWCGVMELGGYENR